MRFLAQVGNGSKFIHREKGTATVWSVVSRIREAERLVGWWFDSPPKNTSFCDCLSLVSGVAISEAVPFGD